MRLAERCWSDTAVSLRGKAQSKLQAVSATDLLVEISASGEESILLGPQQLLQGGAGYWDHTPVRTVPAEPSASS